VTSRIVALVISAAVLASAAHGQEGTQCNFQGSPDRPVQVLRLPSGQSNTFTGGGVVVRCPARQITLRADSLEYYGDERRIFLVGNVDYDEPRLKLTSDQLTYYVPDERVVAIGRVNATLPSGSRLVGPQAEYRRVAPRVRTISEMTAVGRPSVTLVEGPRSRRDSVAIRRDSATARRDPAAARRDTTNPPTVVTANTLFVRGDSLIYGSGQVDIRRPDLTAHSDSVFLDTGREFMRLLRNPRIEGRRDRPYRLAGQIIDVYSRNRQLERVVAKGSGSAVSEDMTLTADTIDLRVASDLLQQAVAWGPGGARAVSPTQTITADSITAAMPGQRLRTVTASRRALAEAKPDTARIQTTEKDWLRGDTIVARFDTAAAAPTDTARQPQIKQLVARGDARSLYHLPPADSTTRVPAINYVTGVVITIAFDSQRVARVTVAGQRSGVYLEPTDSSAASPARPPAAQAAPGAVPPGQRPTTPAQRRPVSTGRREPEPVVRRPP
jgi:lipopolysaccharide export system protein LptA